MYHLDIWSDEIVPGSPFDVSLLPTAPEKVEIVEPSLPEEPGAPIDMPVTSHMQEQAKSLPNVPERSMVKSQFVSSPQNQPNTKSPSIHQVMICTHSQYISMTHK